jgi:hypothetical protein
MLGSSMGQNRLPQKLIDQKFIAKIRKSPQTPPILNSLVKDGEKLVHYANH